MFFSPLDLSFNTWFCILPISKSLLNLFLCSFLINVFVDVIIPKFLKLLLYNSIRRNIIKIPTLRLYSFTIVVLNPLTRGKICIVIWMLRLIVSPRSKTNLIFWNKRWYERLMLCRNRSWTYNSWCLRSCRRICRINVFKRVDLLKCFPLKCLNSIFSRWYISMNSPLSCLKGCKHFSFCFFFIH